MNVESQSILLRISRTLPSSSLIGLALGQSLSTPTWNTYWSANFTNDFIPGTNWSYRIRREKRANTKDRRAVLLIHSQYFIRVYRMSLRI